MQIGQICSWFCEKVEINPAYFSQITNQSKALGDELARRIERNLGLPIGYIGRVGNCNGGDSDGGQGFGELDASCDGGEHDHRIGRFSSISKSDTCRR